MKFKMLILLLIVSVTFSNERHKIKVALSFDDAPKSDGAFYSGKERTDILLNIFDKHSIQTVFYVVSVNFEDNSKLERIHRYDSANHIIANHTHTHPNLGNISAKQYINEIKRCDNNIKIFKNYKKWFRYTYLNQSNDIPKRDSVWDYLDKENYLIGYCTIDNYDWHIDQLAKIAYTENPINFENLKSMYLNHILESVFFYDNIAVNSLGYSPNHVLLLHANDINALFLDDMIELFKKNNIEIISPEEAYSDKIARIRPDVTQNYQGRVAAIAYSRGYKNRIHQISEDTEYLDSLFKISNIIN